MIEIWARAAATSAIILAYATLRQPPSAKVTTRNVSDRRIEEWMQHQTDSLFDFETKFSEIALSLPTRATYAPHQRGVQDDRRKTNREVTNYP